MTNVDVVGALAYAVEHEHVIPKWIVDGTVEAERLRYTGHKIDRHYRIAASDVTELVVTEGRRP